MQPLDNFFEALLATPLEKAAPLPGYVLQHLIAAVAEIKGGAQRTQQAELRRLDLSLFIAFKLRWLWDTNKIKNKEQ